LVEGQQQTKLIRFNNNLMNYDLRNCDMIGTHLQCSDILPNDYSLETSTKPLFNNRNIDDHENFTKSHLSWINRRISRL